MKLLLDTHAYLWWLSDNRALSRPARTAISEPDNPVFVSAATIWEAEIKVALGRLRTGRVDLAAEIERSGFHELAISGGHARDAARLPPLHADPFDRMLAAQALSAGLVCVTRDTAIADYGAPVLW